MLAEGIRNNDMAVVRPKRFTQYSGSGCSLRSLRFDNNEVFLMPLFFLLEVMPSAIRAHPANSTSGTPSTRITDEHSGRTKICIPCIS